MEPGSDLAIGRLNLLILGMHFTPRERNRWWLSFMAEDYPRTLWGAALGKDAVSWADFRLRHFLVTPRVALASGYCLLTTAYF